MNKMENYNQLVDYCKINKIADIVKRICKKTEIKRERFIIDDDALLKKYDLNIIEKIDFREVKKWQNTTSLKNCEIHSKCNFSKSVYDKLVILNKGTSFSKIKLVDVLKNEFGYDIYGEEDLKDRNEPNRADKANDRGKT